MSAVTHMAEIKEIKPYQDSGKYEVVFKGPAQEIKHIPICDRNNSPQGPIYAERERLLNAVHLEDALK